MSGSRSNPKTEIHHPELQPSMRTRQHHLYMSFTRMLGNISQGLLCNSVNCRGGFWRLAPGQILAAESPYMSGEAARCCRLLLSTAAERCQRRTRWVSADQCLIPARANPIPPAQECCRLIERRQSFHPALFPVSRVVFRPALSGSTGVLGSRISPLRHRPSANEVTVDEENPCNP